MRSDTRYPTHHDSVLFVSIGEDSLFSTVLATLALRQLGWTWKRSAIASALSPFYDHNVIKTGARCLRVIHGASTRSIPTPDGQPERRIDFVDAVMGQRVLEGRYTNCDAAYGLDLIGGSHNLVRTFKRLALRYDMIILVDVGGDCLYRGLNDDHVLATMSDAITLRAFVDAQVPGLLFMAGPGTDGGLRIESMRWTLDVTGAEPHPLDPDAIDAYERFSKQSPVLRRNDQTVLNLIKAFRSNERTVEVGQSISSMIGQVRYVHSRSQPVDTEMCRRFYLIEPRKIRNPLMRRCDGPKDWFIKTQHKLGRCSTEADLQYLRVGDEIWRFATPSPLFGQDFRRLMLRHAMNEIQHQHDCDGLWILPQDASLIEDLPSSGLEVQEDAGLIALRRST